MPSFTYVTTTSENDFLRVSGVDLNTELTARLTDDVGDNNPAPRFIYFVENYLKEKILEHNPFYGADILDESYEFESNHQSDMFKRAVCYQISYLLKTGNVTNINKLIAGMLTEREIANIGLDMNAERALRIGGLWNIGRC